MKKLLFLMMVLLVSGAILAQGTKERTAMKSFLAFHAGPSFPVGDFASNTFANEDAGFAKTGYYLNLSYGYQLFDNLGLAASLFYNNHKPDNVAIQTGIGEVTEGNVFAGKLNHWQWYGLTAGPMFTHQLVNNLSANLRIMGGIANANFPKVVSQGEVIVKDDWSVAGIFQTGLDLRLGIGRNMFVFTNFDYQYMKPGFNLVFPDESPAVRGGQKISVLNLTGGFGIRF